MALFYMYIYTPAICIVGEEYYFIEAVRKSSNYIVELISGNMDLSDRNRYYIFVLYDLF